MRGHLLVLTILGTSAVALAAAAGPLGLGLPALPNVGGTLGGVTNRATGTLDQGLNDVRDAVGRPRAPRALEKDANGFRVVRGQVLALSPADSNLSIARSLNFSIIRQEALSSLGLSIALLGVPDGLSATDALAQLRKADPTGVYDLDHVYDPSGERDNRGYTQLANSAAATQSIRIGMIDGGLDSGHDAFARAKIISAGCSTKTRSAATKHGTAVASLLVGSDSEVSGAVPGATLYAADVYCGQPDGGSAEAIARALGWLAASDVPVVNVSLAGPPNAILAAAVGAFVKRGRVLVAAVGNDGPAAPLEYPAAYPGVAGVTSVDDKLEVQTEANRGPDIAFAARGVDVSVASLHDRHDTVTGTSFAAPTAAARFALLLPRTDPGLAAKAWNTLERAAVHLGSPGRNETYGYGYLDRPGVAVNATTSR